MAELTHRKGKALDIKWPLVNNRYCIIHDDVKLEQMTIKHKFLSYYKGKNIFWIRVYGYGFCIKDWRTFSERLGNKASITILGFTLTLLRP